MSRNLGMSDCYYCNAELELDEPPRLIRPEDAGVYYPEYGDMIVAKAHCPDCWALYLAWMGKIPHRGAGMGTDPPGPCGQIQDLSFRSSFNDEPAYEDLPQFHIVQHLELERVPFGGIGAAPPPNTLRRRWR